MTEKFIIEGGKPLEGEIEVRGYKNSAGAVLAASILTDEEVIIDNLPLIEDVFTMIEILKSMGVEVEWLDKRKIKLKAGDKVNPEKMDFGIIPKTRISVLLIGSFLSRFKDFKISHPGGDRIGIRPITIHLEAIKKLGVEITQEGDFYRFKNIGHSPESEIILKEFSVTATENLMMALVKSSGRTIIKGVAIEPQVQDLGEMLKKMGAKIEGLGTHTIIIDGVEKLKGTSHKIIPDLIEAGTFIVMGALTPGEVKVKNIFPDHLDIFLDKLEEMGVNFKKGNDFIIVNYSPNLKPVKVQSLPFPGFPTDLLPLITPLLIQAEGKSLIHDPLYENRFGHLQEMKKMGADIEIVSPHRSLIFGKTPLRGLTIESWDIRAGASLIIAGLLAKGKTTIGNIYQIDRGYEKIEERLQKLGADIKRVNS